MDNPNEPRLTTVSNRNLSLWQSATAATVKEILLKKNDKVTNDMVYAHPMVLGASKHVSLAEIGLDYVPVSNPLLRDETSDVHPSLSKLSFDIANAELNGDEEKAEELRIWFRKYSTGDLAGWATCITAYKAYYTNGKTPVYRMLGSTEYGAIDWKIPNDGKVAIIGDWGTGMDDAKALLNNICNIEGLSAIIHLGDIYYSGTPPECQSTIIDIFNDVFDMLGRRLPVFMIPGNHDYYSGGQGFYNCIDAVNSAPGTDPSWVQKASYFCLRTEDDSWQFLGMDTGYNDHTVSVVDGQNGAPGLQLHEEIWHYDRLEEFEGQTILLSHHQLFSAKENLEGGNTNPNRWTNGQLLESFSPFFNAGVSAWLWGHEHSLVLYRDGILNLDKGRLVGCSAYEARSWPDDPYAVNFPQAAFLDPVKYRLQLGPNSQYYNHGYMLLDFGNRNELNQVCATYYQYPSWGGTIPSVQWPLSSELYNEYIGYEQPNLEENILFYYDLVRLEFVAEGKEIGPGIQYGPTDWPNVAFPQLSADPGSGVQLFLGIQDGMGVGYLGAPLKDGSIVMIQSGEAQLGFKNILSSRNFENPGCFYNNTLVAPQTERLWRLRKVNNENIYVHDQDEIYFELVSKETDVLQPLNKNNNAWITAAPAANIQQKTWKIKRASEPSLKQKVPMRYGDKVQLMTLDGNAIIKMADKHDGKYATDEYFPVVGDGTQAITLQIIGGTAGDVITEFSTVQFKTLEQLPQQNYDILGGWGDAWCFYYKPGWKEENWTINSLTATPGAILFYGEKLLIHNTAYTQNLTPTAAFNKQWWLQIHPDALVLWKMKLVE